MPRRTDSPTLSGDGRDEHLFVLRVWTEAGHLRGVIRDTGSGSSVAFASRAAFIRAMNHLVDGARRSRAPPSDADPE